MDERKPNRRLREYQSEIAEDFIGGLKKLFEDHYIDVPDEKYNVLEDQSKIEELEKKLNESIDKNVELNKANGELKRQDIIDETSEDLVLTLLRRNLTNLLKKLSIQMKTTLEQK